MNPSATNAPIANAATPSVTSRQVWSSALIALFLLTIACYATEYATQNGILRDPFRGVVGQFLSRQVNVIFVVGSIAWLVLGPLATNEKRWPRVSWVAIAGVAYFVFCQIPKSTPLFWAPRPGFTHARGEHSGFPSGHTLPALLLAFLLISVTPRLTWPALIVASLIGWSRVLVGAHFAWQVSISALIGSILGAGLMWARAKFLLRDDVH